MGLGAFRFRVLAIFIVALVIWQSTRIWSPFTPEDPNSSQSQVKLDADIGEDHVETEKKVQKVNVAVYYEALCPDSRSFVVKQLLPTFKKIPEYINVELVPYGKAMTINTKDGYEFTCQHGPTECIANIVHACAIDNIKNTSVQLDYISCMIQKNLDPYKIMKDCASKMQLDYNTIQSCAEGSRGKDLLFQYGVMTDSLKPSITFIPTITLDKLSDNQLAILKNLLQQVCLRLDNPPEECS